MPRAPSQAQGGQRDRVRASSAQLLALHTDKPQADVPEQRCRGPSVVPMASRDPMRPGSWPGSGRSWDVRALLSFTSSCDTVAGTLGPTGHKDGVPVAEWSSHGGVSVWGPGTGHMVLEVACPAAGQCKAALSSGPGPPGLLPSVYVLYAGGHKVPASCGERPHTLGATGGEAWAWWPQPCSQQQWAHLGAVACP